MNVNIDNLNKNSLIMQWNVDTNGNPASVRIENEVQQISTTHNLIQLAQIPDEYYRMQIGVDGESDWLEEVCNRDEITVNTYYVDYGLGYVYFDESHKGKAVIANYYGRGVILLSDSRIFHTKGSTFVDTWDNIIERSKDALELLESSGGLANAIKTIDEKVEQGNQVADRIEDFISETEFYGYTILLSREAFVIKAKEDGNVETGEYGDIYTDVVVYKGATQVTAPTLNISLTNQVNCEFEVIGQRIKLKTGSMNVDAIKGQATVVIDCGDGLVAHRIIEVTKVFDGVSQYQVEIGNSFYSFNANSDGKIEEEQSVTCDINVTKANELYESYTVSIQNMPKGLTHNIVNGTKTNRVTFTATTGESLPDNGSVSIVVQMADNIVISKTFSFGKTKQGVDAKSLILTGNQIVKYDTPDYTGTPSPYRSIVHAQASGLSGTPNWYVLNENEEWELIIGQSSTTLEVYYNDSVIWKDRKETTIKCELDGYSDEITLIKIANGATGSDAYSILLSNESTTIPTDKDGVAPINEIQKHYTVINVYRGAERISPTNIQVESSAENLYEVSVSGNTIRLINISNNVDSITIPIEVVVDGLTLKRSWNIAKSKQGATGVSGSTLVLNVDGGTRSIVYNQMNVNPIPSVSTQFIARLYDNGEEVIGNVGYYWSCVGHVSGTSTSKTFTPGIADTYTESISSNQITVVATYKGNKISHTVPVVISKTVEGLDWVTDWDSTKVSIRGTEVLTPKIFAGTYDEASNSITGVAIGQDVLNDGQTIGVVAYQNNVATFLLGTDGSVEVGDPYQRRTEHGLGIGYNNGQFVGRFSNLTIEGVNVPTTDEVSNSINQAVVNAQNQVREEMKEVNEALINLNDYVNGSLKDGILDKVEKVKIEGLLEIIKQEATDVDGQYISISTNQYLTDAFVIELLENAYNSYKEAYNNVLTKYSELANGTTTNTDEFTESISNFRIASNDLYQVFNNALTSISEVQAILKSEEAKNEVIREVNDVSDALAGLEQTMNGDFKNGLLGQMNLANLRERLKQLDIEKKDIDGQYSVMSTHSALDTTTKNKLVSVKGKLDSAHTQLVTKINAVITDNLLTSAELEEVNKLIVAYSTALGEYSKVAQEANIAIAVNSAKNAVDAITDEDVFNKVTNFGKTQGLFIENGGKVYINAQYIQTRGFVATKDDGTKTFEIDKNGNVNITANSFSLSSGQTVATEDYVNGVVENIKNANITFSLSNEFQVIPTNSKLYPFARESFVVVVKGYKASDEITNFAIGTPTTMDGITIAVSNVNHSVTFTVSTTTSLGANHGYIDIPITYEGKTYTKRWSWSAAKQSDQAPQVSISGEQVFKYTNNFTGTPTPASIVLTANVYNTTVTGKWQYLNSSSWVDCNVTAKTLSLQPTSYTLSSLKRVTVRYIVEEVFDTFTVVAVSDGANGVDGQDGANGQDGADGKGIVSITEQYYHSTSMTTQTGGSWSTTVPTATRGKYIWTRSVIKYTDSTTTTTPICVSGSDGTNGNNGVDGTDGIGITSVDVEYAQNTSTTTAPTSGWTTTSPTWASGKYIWSRTKTTYSNGKVTYTNPACITGQKGDTGASGKGIKSITQYYLATSLSTGVTTSTSGWSTGIPTMTTTNKYLWNYETIAYTDSSSTTTTPAIIGVHGANGTNGSNGVGIKSITEYYLATSSSSGVTTSTSGWTTTIQTPSASKKYLWNYEVVTYTDNNKYTGTPRIIGNYATDGQNGTDAITIVLTNENHTFSANSSGNITSAQSTTTNITAYKGAGTTTVTIGTLPTITGLTLSKSDSTVTIQANTGTSLAETGTFSIPLVIDGKSFTKNFSWTKVRAGETGATGASAKAVDIIASSLVFKSTDGGKVFAPNTIKLTPKLQNLTYYNWQYSTNGGSTWTTVTSGLNGLTISSGELTISKDSPLFTSIVTSLSFRLNTNDTAYYDVVTIVKLYDVADVDFDKIAQDKVDNYDSALNQQKVFEKLTNNGQSQGIYLENDKLYVNGEYVNTRNLKAVKNDGTETFKIDSEGNVSIKANSFYLTGSDTNIAGKDYVDTAISNVDVDLTQEGVFNALTNDGQNQGLYIEDGELYVNAEYIQTGTIRADLVKVQVDGKENILPFNYVTFKSGIESWLNIDETNEGIPFIETEMPIYQGGGSNSYFCRKLGSSTVYLESNTRYFFSCDIYANVPRDGVETYGVGGSTGTGAELTLMTAMNERYVTEGRYVPILVINSLALKTVDGQWTHITYEFTTPAESEFYSLSNHMYIELNGSNYNTGSYGYVRIANMALEKATEGQATASTFDYLTQLKERRIDLTDDKFYHTRLSIDGFSTEEGIIEGTTTTDGHDYLLNYDGLTVSKSPRERYFVGKDKSYYSYEAGSSGIISGHNNIYGVGGVHCNPSDEYAGYRGIFAGVHYGFQIPNSTAFGRPDIYVHNGQWGMNFEEWQLLGDTIEPRGLVRRDDSKNITTNHQLKFLVGGGTNTANVWNQEQYNTTGNGQMLTYSAGKVYVSNPQTPLVLESNATPSVKIGGGVEHQIFHTGYVPKSGNWWNGGAVRVSGDGVAGVGKYIDFHNSNGTTADFTSRITDNGGTIETSGGFKANGAIYTQHCRVAVQASHGGLDLGNTDRNTAILSANVPTWWNGVGSYRIYNEGFQQTSTSDIRYKRALSPINTDSCYNMVKNININSYLLLDEGVEDEHEVDRAFLRATQEEGISRKLQMGVIAQDLLKYDFGQYVVVQDVIRDEETGEITNDKYSIDAYNYASAILGGLQKEIQIRDEQYEELKQENEELKAKVDSLEQRLARLEALLGQE